MLVRTASLLAALSGAVSGHQDTCQDTGYEVWQRQLDPDDVHAKVEEHLDKDTCMYELSMSFDGRDLSKLGIPFMDEATRENLTTDYTVPFPVPPGDVSDFSRKCIDEGIHEVFPPFGVPPPWGFPPGNVGENEYYTDFGVTMKLSKKASEATGFKEVTIGASPCGTATQAYPHYSVHFYTVDKDFRETMECYSEGGYFCKPIEQQCSDAGRRMQMDGVGIPKCEDGRYANTLICPEGTPPFAWTINGLQNPPFNAASPAMGLHGTCPVEFFPTKDPKDPYLLLVQYDSKIVGNHIVFWSGFANGQGLADENQMRYDYPNMEYNCQDEHHRSLPTSSYIEYNAHTGRTTTFIKGPAKEEWCGKGSKAPKSTKKSKPVGCGGKKKKCSSDEDCCDGYICYKKYGKMEGKCRDASKGQSKSKSKTDKDCPVNGYEIWHQADPENVDLRVETTVDEDSCMYEISLSFMPDPNIPFMADNTPVDGPVTPADEVAILAPFRDNPDERAAWNGLCEAEGRFENPQPNLNPAWTTVPNFMDGNHVGLQEFNTEYTHTMELPKKVKKITGVDHVTVGATPCGTRLQMYSHYNIHFYFSSIKERKKMTCITDGGYFCKDSQFQTCGDGLRFNMDGSTMTCEDGVTPANIPVGHGWTSDGALPAAVFGEKTNAAAAGQGHHSLNGRTLVDVTFRPMDMPSLLILGYDREITAAHFFNWAGFPLGHSSANDFVWPGNTPDNTIEYNCQDMKKYRRLPTYAAASYDPDNGRTTYTLRGPAGKKEGKECKDFSDVTMAGGTGKSKTKSKGMAHR